MKKILSISSKEGFKQYLMLSEARYISKMCEDFGVVIVEIVEITKEKYKSVFGK